MDHGPMATDMGDPIREAEEYVSRSIHPAPPGSIMSFVACTLSQLLARSSGQTGGSVLHASAELGRSILCGRALDAADPSRASARGRGGFRTSFVEGPLDARPPFTPQPGTGQDASTYHAFQAPTGVGAGAGASDADANADADVNISHASTAGTVVRTALHIIHGARLQDAMMRVTMARQPPATGPQNVHSASRPSSRALGPGHRQPPSSATNRTVQRATALFPDAATQAAEGGECTFSPHPALSQGQCYLHRSLSFHPVRSACRTSTPSWYAGAALEGILPRALHHTMDVCASVCTCVFATALHAGVPSSSSVRKCGSPRPTVPDDGDKRRVRPASSPSQGPPTGVHPSACAAGPHSRECGRLRERVRVGVVEHTYLPHPRPPAGRRG
ncbi:hypothetical protein RJ55_02774 [Drechmeria coniospora]|nr:hypothetical protein RJ55_02774 [Drechmeria coniospora]